MIASVRFMMGTALMIVISAIGCRHHEPEEAQPVFETGPIHWGEPANGLQAGLAIKKQVSGPKNIAWRPVRVEFCLRNVSQQPIRIIEPFISCVPMTGGGRPMVDARFAVAGGEVYRIGMFPPARPSFQIRSIAPGEFYSVKGQFGSDLVIAPGYWGLTEPVEGDCVLSFHNPSPTTELWIGVNQTASIHDLWTGNAESAPMRIRFDDASDSYNEADTYEG